MQLDAITAPANSRSSDYAKLWALGAPGKSRNEGSASDFPWAGPTAEITLINRHYVIRLIDRNNFDMHKVTVIASYVCGWQLLVFKSGRTGFANDRPDLRVQDRIYK
jgi:hypothetical protein